MCNNYEQRVTWDMYAQAVMAAGFGVPSGEGDEDLPQADDVRIGDPAPVMRAAGNGVGLATMRFGFAPVTPRGGPVFNFRSEGRRFEARTRCLVPASAFFEFTGKRYPKTKHRFTWAGAPVFAIAGLWRTGSEGTTAFTMLTAAPGEDVSPFHSRGIVVLPPARWAAWLYPDDEASLDLLHPPGRGSLAVETVRSGRDEREQSPLDLLR